MKKFPTKFPTTHRAKTRKFNVNFSYIYTKNTYNSRLYWYRCYAILRVFNEKLNENI